MSKKGKKVQPPPNSRRFAAVIVIIGVVGVGILGWALSQPKAGAVTVDPSIPAGAAEGWLMGKADAPVQVIEFGDFECPGCGTFTNLTEPDVRARFINTGVVAFRFFDFPLSGHRNTWAGHLAAGCAGEQGKFWEMHDLIYAHQDEWSGEVTNNPRKFMKRYAGEAGVDVSKWEQCFDTQHSAPRIKGNLAEGERRHITGTPTLIIGSKMLPAGPHSFDVFKAYVDSALAESVNARRDSAGRGKAPAKKGE